MNLKNIGKVVTSKFFETGPSFYEKIIYRAAVSKRLRNTGVDHLFRLYKRLQVIHPPGNLPNFRDTSCISKFVKYAFRDM